MENNSMELELEQKIIKLYQQGLSASQVAQKVGKSKSGVLYILHKYNINTNRFLRNYDTRKYRVKDDYFSIIDTEGKAYFLGFLMADGYVNETHNQVILTLKTDDIEILEKFKNELETDYKIAKFKDNYSRIIITSRQLVEDLANLGVVQAKTNVLKMPNIPAYLQHHLARGYFDGDGSIWYDKHSNAYRFQVLGTKNVLIHIAEYLNLPCNKLRQACSNPNIFRLNYAGNKKLSYIASVMYADATIYLQRKYERFQQCIELSEYNTQQKLKYKNNSI